MKVLLSAIACNPYLGSENFGGWVAAQALAKDHDLWVLTTPRNRPDLERAGAEGLVPKNVRFIYAGRFNEWHRNRLRARLQSWTEYVRFSRAILDAARQHHRAVGFDLSHHISFATWRVGSPLWRLGIPFIFGPVGGNENFPVRFLPVLSPSGAGFELARMLSNAVCRQLPSVRTCIRRASHVFVANPETESLVRNLRGSPHGISRLVPSFFPDDRVQAFARAASLRQTTGPLRLFAGGNLEGRKGIALALRALARVKAEGVSFRFWVGQIGPELSHLQQLVRRLRLEREILFGFLSREDYRKELGTTHIFLLPSLRESTGSTMMEAMLAGCVPIVADCGGPAHIVTRDCGYKVPVSTPKQMIDDMTRTIVSIHRNREIIREKGAAAAQRIATLFTEENYRKTVNSVYG
jgi:glycosyltransferase involved in cell wall biosynthesis